ncbi:MAG: adenylate/guanylate cyclase domain-containing protein [Methylocystis sp.]|uniref:adenylate/guanylate cyclase domain-containing protein n=1 Tax=Methylocystis sp. TaxID=1911079 RepID=UPI003DA3FCE3
MFARSSFASRLVALVTGSVITSTLLASGLSAWSFYSDNLVEIERQGLTVARLLARASAVANQTPKDVEQVIAKHMIVAATSFAEFVAAAEKAGFTPAQINDRLTRAVDRTILDEIWITDEKGFAYLHTNTSSDFQFSPSARDQPQAHQFWELLTGGKESIVQDIQKREIDNEKFKYVGVPGVDKRRIVEVGYNARYFDSLEEQIGLQRVVDSLLAGDEIDAIFIFDTGSRLIVSPRPGAEPEPGKLSDAEILPVAGVLSTGVPKSMQSDTSLSVIAPINREDGALLGAALIRLPITRLGEHVRAQLQAALAISVATSLLGAAMAAWIARRQTAPIEAITTAASNIEHEHVLDEGLAAVAARGDELGQLARVFRTMAQEFLTREKTLDALVVQRTAALEEKNSELERLSARLSKYLSPQLYETLFRGAKVAPTSSQRKKLTILFADIVSFSEIAESLESEDLTRVLNEFLNEMAEVALKHGATIDKYIGDAVMVFFGDPKTRGVAEDARACVFMAMEMLEAARRLDHKWRESGLGCPLQIRIGVNTGYCTVGDFGSQQRMDYTIIGHQVNLAARIEKAAAPGSILLSHETWSLVRRSIRSEEQAPIVVKGIHAPVQTYKVLGPAKARGDALIHEESEGVLLKVDLDAADRREVKRILSSALKQIDARTDAGEDGRIDGRRAPAIEEER